MNTSFINQARPVCETLKRAGQKHILILKVVEGQTPTVWLSGNTHNPGREPSVSRQGLLSGNTRRQI